MSSQKYFITTAIPYANGDPHIGHALEFVQSDVLARYNRIIGNDTFFMSGLDENSLKNVRAAEDRGITAQELCDEKAEVFTRLLAELNVSTDTFVRTSSAEHIAGAQKLWSACKPEDIYTKTYSGHYCVGCEAYYAEGELVDGKCPEHLVEPEFVEEENYFFKLSNYQDQLLELIESGELAVTPAFRKNEVTSFIKMGLEDFSISRSNSRAKNWGVTVPGDDSQVMYVWFDALSNYITGLGYGSNDETQFNKYWPADVHVIGKGISRFHAIYWPAMLLSAGLPLPKRVLVHGYISVDGQKMSKSLGNVVDPFSLVSSYGVDAVRYFLLREIPAFEDGDFSQEKFIERYNADLANDLGNLVSRVSNMVQKYMEGVVYVDNVHFQEDEDVSDFINSANEALGQYKYNDALEHIWKAVRQANKLVESKQPWDLHKTGNIDELERVLTVLVAQIQSVGLALEPFLPHTAESINTHFTANTIEKFNSLFPRII